MATKKTKKPAFSPAALYGAQLVDRIVKAAVAEMNDKLARAQGKAKPAKKKPAGKKAKAAAKKPAKKPAAKKRRSPSETRALVEKVMAFVQEDSRVNMTLAEIAQGVGLKAAEVARPVALLVKQGVFSRLGDKKNSTYMLTPSPAEVTTAIAADATPN